MKRTLAEFARVCGGRLSGSDAAYTDVVSDSRTLAPQQLFVALKGPRFDGHEFVGAALALGLHLHRRLVGMNALGREHVGADQQDERHQRCGADAHPIGQRGDVEVDAFARIGRALAVERQMQPIFSEQDSQDSRRVESSCRRRQRVFTRPGTRLGHRCRQIAKSFHCLLTDRRQFVIL